MINIQEYTQTSRARITTVGLCCEFRYRGLCATTGLRHRTDRTVLAPPMSADTVPLGSILDPRQRQRQLARRHWDCHLVLRHVVARVPGCERWDRAQAAFHQLKLPGERWPHAHPALLAKNRGVSRRTRHLPAVL